MRILSKESVPFSLGMDICVDDIIWALSRLYQSKIILMESERASIHNKVSLNIAMDDVKLALGKANEKFLADQKKLDSENE